MSQIEECTSKIEKCTFGIEERTSKIEKCTFGIEERTGEIEERTSKILQRWKSTKSACSDLAGLGAVINSI